MRSFPSFTDNWRRPFWALLLVTASVVFSFAFACAMPFPALCAIAVFALPRRDAFCAVGTAWLANQAVGFACLHYPWTANCLAWGAAIGLSALLCTLAALGVRRWLMHMPPVLAHIAAFTAAWVVFELALATSALGLGGLEDFTPSILGRILGINAAAWVGLFALNWIGTWSGIAHSSAPLPRLSDEAAMG